MTTTTTTPPTTSSSDEIRAEVQRHYAEVAKSDGACGCGPGCCAPKSAEAQAAASLALGYSSEELASLPQGTDLGLGCGTPLAFAELRAGDVVVDLGSGGGIDCLLAARQVGDGGRVIGVDMTPEMIAKARANIAKVDAKNVEVRLGEIEHLPLADRSADVVISNCVVNLSPDKRAVIREIARVLRPGGRVAIADIVASAPLPDTLRRDLAAHAGCIAGAAPVEEVRAMLADAGLVDVTVEVDDKSRSFIRDWLPGSNAESYVASARIRAAKPRGTGCCDTASTSSCC